MNRIILLVVLLSPVFGLLAAETILGVWGGLNLTNVLVDDPDFQDYYEPKVGFHLGGFAQHIFSDILIIQPELLINMKGLRFKSFHNAQGVLETPASTDTYYYLEAALLGKINLAVGDLKLQPYLGPAAGYLLLARYSASANILGFSGDDSADVSKRIAKLDLGLTAGSDLIFMDNLLLGIRLNLGFTDVFKDSILKSQNAGIMLSMGYLMEAF